MQILYCSLLAVCALGVVAVADDFTGKSPDGKLAFGSKNDKEIYI